MAPGCRSIPRMGMGVKKWRQKHRTHPIRIASEQQARTINTQTWLLLLWELQQNQGVHVSVLLSSIFRKHKGSIPFPAGLLQSHSLSPPPPPILFGSWFNFQNEHSNLFWGTLKLCGLSQFLVHDSVQTFSFRIIGTSMSEGKYICLRGPQGRLKELWASISCPLSSPCYIVLEQT